MLPYALSYTRITAVGMPLLIIINGMSNLARADGRPTYSMLCMLLGAVINTILDPVFIFVCKWGGGRGLGHGAGPGRLLCDGPALSQTVPEHPAHSGRLWYLLG